MQTELLLRDELNSPSPAPNTPQAGQRVVSAFALAGERLILGERGGNTRRLIDQFFAQAGLKPRVAMELGRLSAIMRMVESGMGVGVVPFQSAVNEIAEGRLVRWWIEGAQINSELGFAYLNGSYQSPVLKTSSSSAARSSPRSRRSWRSASSSTAAPRRNGRPLSGRRLGRADER